MNLENIKKNRKLLTLIENSVRDQYLKETGNTFPLNEDPVVFDNGQNTYNKLLIPLITLAYENAFLPEIVSVRPMEVPMGAIHTLVPTQVNQTTGVKTAQVSGVGAGSSANPDYSKSTAETDRGDIPSIGIEVVGTGLKAMSRRLKAELTKEVVDDIKAYSEVEAIGETTKLLVSGLNYEIEAHVIKKIKDNAFFADTHAYTTPTGTENIKNPGNRLFVDVMNMGAKIGVACRSGMANFIIIPPKFVKDTIMMEEFEGQEAEYYSYIQKIGTLNKFMKVFVNPLETEDKIIVGYNSNNSKMPAGLIYAPYSFNVYNTNNVDNLNYVQAIFARYALEFFQSSNGAGVGIKGQKNYGVLTVTGAPALEGTPTTF